MRRELEPDVEVTDCLGDKHLYIVSIIPCNRVGLRMVSEVNMMLTRSRSSELKDTGDLLRGRFDLSLSPLEDMCVLEEPVPSVLEASSEPKSEKDRFRGPFVGVKAPELVPETRNGLFEPSIR